MRANEITDITESVGTSWPTPTHDAVGNMTLMPQPGSLGNSYDGKYDAWNRLVEVKVTGGSVVGSYAYDGLNRRVSKTVSSSTRHFYYSKDWQILEERVDSGTSADRQFVWGQRYLDDLVLRDKGSQRLYVLHDFFHPTSVINTSGAVQERYHYDAFGTSLVMDANFGSRSSSNYEWETRFGAYRWDSESGLYQVRNRYLHAKLGRWARRDPVEEIAGLNLYVVVLNNPISSVDPHGLLQKYCFDPVAAQQCVDAARQTRDFNIAQANKQLNVCLAYANAQEAGCHAYCDTLNLTLRPGCKFVCNAIWDAYEGTCYGAANVSVALAWASYLVAQEACGSGATLHIPICQPCPPGTVYRGSGY